MRKYAWLFLSIGLTFSLVGCGDSGSSGGSGGSGGGGTMVTVTGTVTAASIDNGVDPPVADATVSIVGTANTATSDAEGNFSIMAPTGTVMFLTTADGNWGSLFAENVPGGGVAGLEVEVIPDALVGEVAAALEATVDESKGLVAVVFDDTTTVGGESASISANSELPFIFAADEPEEGDTLCGETDCGSEVLFLNTDVAATVTATATNASAQSCPLEFPGASYSVQAKVLTEIDVLFCP
ncbi:MAG: hypothetical protein JRD92_05140 [Deltaproteobacteria bacterium]|nr:hypothetical protein [Deltaproteobacteria bacterium]